MNAPRELVIDPTWPARGKYAICTQPIGEPGTRQIPTEALLMITDVMPGEFGARTVFVAYVPPDDLKTMATVEVWEGILRPVRPVIEEKSLGSIDDKDIFIN